MPVRGRHACSPHLLPAIIRIKSFQILGNENHVITSADLRRRLCFWCGLFVCLFVCLSVCLSVCPSDYSQTCEQILAKFFWGVGHGSTTKWYNFGGDPDHALDPGVQSPKSGSSGSAEVCTLWAYLVNHLLLPPVTCPYSLRERHHNRQQTCKNGHRNFLTRKLYEDIYWTLLIIVTIVLYILPCILPCVASRGSDLHEA